MKKIDLSKYKIKQSTEKETKTKPFQKYAMEVCEEFGIIFPYKNIIFRQAKKNISYLRGKVENTRERFDNKDLINKGRYLISLFKSKKPWDK